MSHFSFLSSPFAQIAQVGKLKPLEVELTKLEDLSSAIVQDFEYMKKREEEMRDTNGTTRPSLLNVLLHANIWGCLCSYKKFPLTKCLLLD